jgi:hypothetical protein
LRRSFGQSVWKIIPLVLGDVVIDGILRPSRCIARPGYYCWHHPEYSVLPKSKGGEAQQLLVTQLLHIFDRLTVETGVGCQSKPTSRWVGVCGK